MCVCDEVDVTHKSCSQIYICNLLILHPQFSALLMVLLLAMMATQHGEIENQLIDIPVGR